jgi:transposase
MTKHCTRQSAKLKAKVALADLSETKTLAELSSEYGIHPTQITRWEQELVANAPNFLTTMEGQNSTLVYTMAL